MTVSASLIEAAADVLGEVLRFEHAADSVLSSYFRDNRALGAFTRNFIAETVYGVLRRRRFLERLAGGPTTPRRLVLLASARLGGHGLRQLRDALSAAETDWLSLSLARDISNATLAEQLDLPDWLCDRLRSAIGEQALCRLARSLNQTAPLDLRSNPLKCDRASVVARLQDDGIPAEPGPFSPLAVRLPGRPVLARHPLYTEGLIEVQDEGSQLLSYLVAPRRGEMVVDFCAGAGGKTLHLGALMRSSGRLYAFDVSAKRLARLRPRVARAGLSNVHAVVLANENDAHIRRLAGKIDRVLIDAPCSGLGTLRRNPDLKWRQTPDSVAELTAKQRQILASAARLVKLGGRLVYATCSVLPEENDEIVGEFLSAHPEFRTRNATQVLRESRIEIESGDALRLNPDRHGTDAFFAVVMERIAANALSVAS